MLLIIDLSYSDAVRHEIKECSAAELRPVSFDEMRTRRSCDVIVCQLKSYCIVMQPSPMEEFKSAIKNNGVGPIFTQVIFSLLTHTGGVRARVCARRIVFEQQRVMRCRMMRRR